MSMSSLGKRFTHRVKVENTAKKQKLSSASEPAINEVLHGLDIVAEGNDPVVDIVAVHGLNGHRDKTWTALNGVHWLRDLLPNDIPNARVFCWGYDANTHGKHLSCQYLYDHATTLVSELCLERELTETTRRPIIFVAHSLGGIIVKSALIHSDAARKGALEEHGSVKTSTYGVFFMGTPHQGGNGVQLGQLLLNVASMFVAADDHLMRHLGEHSEWLQQQLGQYGPISRDFVTKFAFEEYETPTLAGHSLLVVPKASAVVQGAADAEPIAIHADHRNMVRFESKENRGYKTVSGHLKLMTRRANNIITSRWEEADKVNAARTSPEENFSVGFSLAGVLETPHFVARQQELVDIHAILCSEDKKESRKAVVLHGLGGIGKTQLAVAYAKRYKSDYSAVFWLNIKDEDAVKQSYTRMAEWIQQHCSTASHLNSFTDASNLDVVAAVMRWLDHPKNTRWLMVFDNYDNPKLRGIPNPTAVDILQFLPNADHGSILVTTRSSQVTVGRRIQVHKLQDVGDSLQILCNASRREDALNDLGAVALAKELDGLPLALATAGAYLEQVATSFQDYLRLYKASWLKLQQTTPELGSYDRQLYTTWQMSYDHIKRQNELSAKLLQLWAYLDNQDLWFELLTKKEITSGEWPVVSREQTPANLEWFAQLTEDEHTFNQAMRVLCNHGLAEPNMLSVRIPIESSGYSMHSCIHEWTIHSLNQKWSDEMSRIALFCVALHCPSQHAPSYWIIRPRLMHHASRCSSSATSKMVQDRFVQLALVHFRNIFQVYLKTYTYDVFLECLEAAAEAPETIDKPAIKSMWANMLRSESVHKKFEKSQEETLQQLLRNGETELGIGDPFILSVCSQLGDIYCDQRKYDQAEKMYKRGLQNREKNFDSEHTSIVDALFGLGHVYRAQRKFDKAEELFSKLLHDFEKVVRPNHLSTLRVFDSLGWLYYVQQKFDLAEHIIQRNLQENELAFGPNHLWILNQVKLLGMVYLDQKKYALAERMLKRALQGMENTVGLRRISTWETAEGLGMAYLSCGRFEEASEMYLRASKGKLVTHGAQHRSTLATIHDLALLYTREGRLIEAEGIFLDLVEVTEKMLGPEDRGTLHIVCSFAVFYQSQERHSEAEELFLRLLPRQEKVHGPDCMATLYVVNGLIEIYMETGRMEKGQQLHERFPKSKPLFPKIDAKLLEELANPASQ